MVPSWWPSPEQPGNGVFHTDYARAFAEAGMRVGVIVPDLVSMRFLGKGTRIPWVPRMTHESLGGVPVIRVRGLHTALHMPSIQMKRFLSWMQRGLEEYLDQQGLPDIIHAMCTVPAGWAAAQVGPSLSRRVVITENTGPFSLVTRKRGQGEFAYEALETAGAVVAVSESTRGQMKTEGVQREVLVCGNPVSPIFADCSLSTSRVTGGVVRGLFVGRLEQAKGAMDLVDAIAKSKLTSLHWRIVGEGPLKDEMLRRLNIAGMATRTYFCGQLTRERLRDEMAQADFLILPTYAESFGMVVAEALCMGLPVITSWGTVCAEFVGREDGVLVNPGDVANIADALKEMTHTVAHWDRAAIARRARQRFSRSAVAAWYGDLFATLSGRISTLPAAPNEA